MYVRACPGTIRAWEPYATFPAGVTRLVAFSFLSSFSDMGTALADDRLSRLLSSNFSTNRHGYFVKPDTAKLMPLNNAQNTNASSLVPFKNKKNTRNVEWPDTLLELGAEKPSWGSRKYGPFYEIDNKLQTKDQKKNVIAKWCMDTNDDQCYDPRLYWDCNRVYWGSIRSALPLWKKSFKGTATLDDLAMLQELAGGSRNRPYRYALYSTIYQTSSTANSTQFDYWRDLGNVKIPLATNAQRVIAFQTADPYARRLLKSWFNEAHLKDLLVVRKLWDPSKPTVAEQLLREGVATKMWLSVDLFMADHYAFECKNKLTCDHDVLENLAHYVLQRMQLNPAQVAVAVRYALSRNFCFLGDKSISQRVTTDDVTNMPFTNANTNASKVAVNKPAAAAAAAATNANAANTKWPGVLSPLQAIVKNSFWEINTHQHNKRNKLNRIKKWCKETDDIDCYNPSRFVSCSGPVDSLALWKKSFKGTATLADLSMLPGKYRPYTHALYAALVGFWDSNNTEWLDLGNLSAPRTTPAQRGLAYTLADPYARRFVKLWMDEDLIRTVLQKFRVWDKMSKDTSTEYLLRPRIPTILWLWYVMRTGYAKELTTSELLSHYVLQRLKLDRVQVAVAVRYALAQNFCR